MDPMKKRKLEENGIFSSNDSDFFTGGDGITVEDSRKILEPFNREQLLAIVQTAVLRHRDVLEAVRSIADLDPAQRKLFVRGLGWETTTEKLRALFAQYGELEEAVVIVDKATGKSKGYGFVIFKHVDGALQALREPSKKIDGRMTVSQLASARNSGGSGGGVGNNPVDVSARKIYVANVPQDMPSERLLAHFLMYGEIEEGPLGFDKETGKSKGFALFVYKTAEGARDSLVDPIKNIDGHQLNCKLAADGKKGKAGLGGSQVGNDGHNDVIGVAGLQGSNAGQYGGIGGGGSSGYSGYSGSSFGGNHLSSGLGGAGGGVGGPVLSGIPSQGALPLGGGGRFGPPYGGGLHYGGLGSPGYGSGAGPGLGGTGGGFGGGAGGVGRGLPPSSGGIPSGDYPQSGPYSSTGYQNQHHQPAGTSPAPRVPTGGLYQGVHPYY